MGARSAQPKEIPQKKTMKKYFLTGFVILLPVALTISFIAFIVNLLTEPFVGLVSYLLSPLHIVFKEHSSVLLHTSQLIVLVFLFLFTVGLGFLARVFFFHKILELGEYTLLRIPFVNTVYKTTKDLIKNIFASEKNAFKQVVMIPFPKPDMFVLGFVAREAPTMCSEAVHQELVSVFIPTTPNPTTGFVLMYKKSDLVFVDMGAEAAIKYIVSCGLIMPEPKK